MKRRSDWYFRKMSKFWQELLDDAANAKRPTKKERRNAKRVNDKAKQHGLKIADWVANCANFLFQGDLGIVTGKQGDTIIFFDNERESVYQRIHCTELDNEDSIFGGLKDSLEFADKFTQQIHHKGKKVNVPSPYWVQQYYKGRAVGVPNLNFKEGGPVDVGSARELDTVYAIVQAFEFVWTKKAVRGAGKGSLDLGSKVLYLLMKQFEREAKNYAQRR
jgi:hypothetical protein|tara:strand:+ start:163 stop:819 length:657 start_codon:yes stop_codon:yes gene_type:complete